MSKIGRPWIMVFAALSLLAAAGVASADDTVVNIGYDEANHVLVANTSTSDSPYDCSLQRGPLRVGYGAEVSGPISVNTVEVEVAPGIFKPVQFLNRPAEEVDPEVFTAADDPIDYQGADGDCGLSGGMVGGPNGQINHGQFMKSFHELVGKADRGCLNRLMAQSELGKGDQQIRTSDVDPDFAAGGNGFIEFETFTADCERGNKEKGEDHPSQNHDRADRGKGKPDRDGSPGNSGSARGRNQ